MHMQLYNYNHSLRAELGVYADDSSSHVHLQLWADFTKLMDYNSLEMSHGVKIFKW